MLVSYFNLASGVCSNVPPVNDPFMRIGTYKSTAARVILLFVIGKTEFCEKYATFAHGLNYLGIDFVAVEPRGQGGSTRFSQDRRSGHVPDHDVLVADIRTLLDSGACLGKRSVPMVIGGHSQGAAIMERVLQTARDDDIGSWTSGVIFTSPMWNISLPIASNATALAWLNIAAPIAPRSKILFGGRTHRPGSEKFEGNVLTADPRRFEQLMASQRMNADVVTSGTSRGWLRSALKLTEDIACGAGMRAPSRVIPGSQADRCRRLEPPGVVFVGEDDRLIDLDKVVEIALTRGMAVERIAGRHEPFIGGISLERLLLARIATFLETRCGIELEPGAVHLLEVALSNEYLMRTRDPEWRAHRFPRVEPNGRAHQDAA